MQNLEMTSKHCVAGLAVLITLQVTMLFALYTKTPPHSPLAIPLFALGPFLGAALVWAALLLGTTASRSGRAAAVLTALFALISFGSHKWFDPVIG